MEQMLKVLDLERELYGLKIDDPNQVKYIDCKKRLEEIYRFSAKVSGSDIVPCYKMDMLERCGEYEKLIRSHMAPPKDSGNRHAIISFVIGLVSGVIGIWLKDLYKGHEKKRMEKVAELVYERIRAIDNA